jgi:hypothetical protein
MTCVQRATLAITRVRRVAGPSCVVTIAAERVIWCDDARWREVSKSPSKLRGDCSSGDCLVDSEWLRALLSASVGVRTDALECCGLESAPVFTKTGIAISCRGAGLSILMHRNVSMTSTGGFASPQSIGQSWHVK